MSSITQIKPKRTLNPYMLFLNKNRSQIKNVLIAVGVEPKVAAVVKAAGTQWRQMSTEEKQPYIDEANTLKDEAQAQANRLNAEAQAQAQAAVLVNTTPEPVSIPPVVHTKETLRTLHTDVVKICECYEVMVDELQETLNNYIDTDTKSQEQLADKQAEIYALQKRVQLLEEEKIACTVIRKLNEVNTTERGAQLRKKNDEHLEKICKDYQVMLDELDELQEALNNYIDTDTKSQEQLADKQAEIDALQKRVQLEEKEKAETEINGAKLRLSSNATSEERKALHLLLKSEKLSIVAMLDDKEVDDLQLSM